MFIQWIKYFLSFPAGSVEKARDDFEKALEVKVTMKRKQAVILGFAGSGKTHTLALLLHNKLPSKRVSTPCFKTPIRSIGLRRFKKSSSSEFCAEISQEEYSQRLMRSGRDALSLMSHRSNEKDANKQFQHTPNEKNDFFPNKLVRRAEGVLFRNSFMAHCVEPLIDEVVAEITDSGGQPQFLEILPRFISGLNIAIVVTNLSERLDECPTSYFYGNDGKLVGKGEPSKITNEQMLHQFLQMVMSQSRENSQIKFLIVGTHRDLEHKCSETREEKERKLLDMVNSFLGNSAVFVDHECEKLIFAVNAENPNEADYEMGQRILEVVMDKDGAETISIPLKFHLLEETLKAMSTTGQIAFKISDILQNVKKYFSNEMSLKEGLQYLEQSNRIFYFNTLFPDMVIGEPQALLNIVTEIVREHILLTKGITTRKAMGGIWKKFKEQGILTIEILNKISNAYDFHFTPKDMLKLLEKLLLVFKRSPGEFLMPCLLSTESFMPTFESQTADPILQISMMLHFPKGMTRIGIFCSTICKLISGEGWMHYDFSAVSRNHFCLSHPNAFGVVCIRDSYDSFFQVILHFPSNPELFPKVLPSTCVALRNTVTRVINEVTHALCYHPDEPVLAFECDKHFTVSYSIHAARYLKDCPSLRCTKDPRISSKITEWHRLWLGECVFVQVAASKSEVAIS